MPDAAISTADMVLRKELAGRAETAYFFHRRGRGGSSRTEELPRRVLVQGMTLVVLTYRAVFPADLAVLFCIRYNIVA